LETSVAAAGPEIATLPEPLDTETSPVDSARRKTLPESKAARESAVGEERARRLLEARETNPGAVAMNEFPAVCRMTGEEVTSRTVEVEKMEEVA